MFSLSQPFGAACEQIVKAHTVSADAANTRGAAGVINASLMCTNERLLDEAARFHRLFPLMCWFLDAGNAKRSAGSTGRRPKTAKARSRGKLGTGKAGGAMRT